MLKERAVAKGSPSITVLSVGNGPVGWQPLSPYSHPLPFVIPVPLPFSWEKFFELGPRPVIGGDQFSLIVDEQERGAAVFQLTGKSFAAAHVVKLDCLLI